MCLIHHRVALVLLLLRYRCSIEMNLKVQSQEIAWRKGRWQRVCVEKQWEMMLDVVKVGDEMFTLFTMGKEEAQNLD